jgi:hypothetical protein
MPEPDEPSNPLTSKPLTFQVYTPREISQGRGPMRSIPPVDAVAAKKAGFGGGLIMALVGGLVVVLTGAAVIAVSTEDPKKPVPVVSVKAPPPPPTTLPEPAPAITIGDPPVDELPAVPSATAPKPKPKTPAALKQIAPPPNPYGN